MAACRRVVGVSTATSPGATARKTRMMKAVVEKTTVARCFRPTTKSYYAFL